LLNLVDPVEPKHVPVPVVDLLASIRQFSSGDEAGGALGPGKLSGRFGRQDDATAEPTTAVVMLREMGMTRGLPEAEAAFSARS
jgi:hypothetical protein